MKIARKILCDTLILIKDKYEFEIIYLTNTISAIRFVFVVRFVVLNESFE